jgi:SAM-dependent methyltransferase
MKALLVTFLLIAAVLFGLANLISNPIVGIFWFAVLGYGAFKFPQIRRKYAAIALGVVLCGILLALANFPYDTDGPKSLAAAANLEASYRQNSQTAVESTSDVEFGNLHNQITAMISSFVKVYRLQNKRILDIGSGTGYLQDAVQDYTGMDIQPGMAKYYHKKYVFGSITQMPFPNDEFDVAWSIYVLEHVAMPEKGLEECRRVIKDGGLLLLFPAWNVPSWKASGYAVRPYSELNLYGIVQKASIKAFRSRAFYPALWICAVRALRSLIIGLHGGPSQLHYRLLEPNTSHYWEPDSDAVNSIDRYEVYRWFETRGDRCLNCSGIFWKTDGGDPLLIQIRK